MEEEARSRRWIAVRSSLGTWPAGTAAAHELGPSGRSRCGLAGPEGRRTDHGVYAVLPEDAPEPRPAICCAHCARVASSPNGTLRVRLAAAIARGQHVTTKTGRRRLARAEREWTAYRATLSAADGPNAGEAAAS